MRKRDKYWLALFCAAIFFFILNFLYEKNYDYKSYDLYIDLLGGLIFGFSFVFLFIKARDEAKS